jgi:predicted SprT family Zn-dependent metalloprotease
LRHNAFPAVTGKCRKGGFVPTLSNFVILLSVITGMVFTRSSAHKSSMSEHQQRSCQCGAVYRRTESTAPDRQASSFECSLCEATLETWNTASVPTYQFLSGPVVLPK